MKPVSRIAAVLFGLVAIAHLYRIVRPFGITVGDATIPQWVSIVALLITGGLALLLWRESRS